MLDNQFLSTYHSNHTYKKSGKDEQLDRPADWAEKFVRKHEDRVYRTAIYIMGNKSDAEDIMQDVFLKVFEKKPRFESDKHEEAWITRVTINQCKSELRLFWRKNRQPLQDVYAARESEEYSRCEWREILDTVNTLPPKYKTAIYLFDYEGYSTKEIAEMTNQKESTVRSQIARARKKLREILSEEEEL